MKLTTNQFLAHCEQTGENDLAQHIVDNFIQSMRLANPNRKDMSSADWLSYMISNYHIEITDNDIQLVPNAGYDYELFTNFDK
jgi:hypothetical protein